MHLFPKVNTMQVFPQQKCCISCVGGILGIVRRCDHEDLWGHLENYINQERFWPQQRRVDNEDPAEELLDVMQLWMLALHQTAQGWVVEKSLSCMKLAKVKKWLETKIIQYFEIMPDLISWDNARKQRSKEKWRWFGALRWPYARITKRNQDDSMRWGGPVPVSWNQNEEKAIHWRFLSRPVCTSQPSLTLSLSLYYSAHFG